MRKHGTVVASDSEIISFASLSKTATTSWSFVDALWVKELEQPQITHAIAKNTVDSNQTKPLTQPFDRIITRIIITTLLKLPELFSPYPETPTRQIPA